MTAPFTSDASQVQARWRTMTAEELAKADTLLGDAERLLLRKVPTIPTRYADDSLDGDLVVQVQVAMVLRVLKNPDGLKSETLGAYSLTREDGQPDGLFVTDEELDLLRDTTTSRGLWTQPTTRYSTADETAWVPVVGTDSLFPWYDEAVEL